MVMKRFILMAAAACVGLLVQGMRLPGEDMNAPGRTLPVEEAGLRRAEAEILALPGMERAQLGILAVSASGDTLLSRNPSRMMTPASNLKLITTGLALEVLGPQYRYVTTLGYTGKVVKGTLKGDVVIIGGGDPTIAAGDSISMPWEETAARWTAILASAGISRIEGRIIGDGSLWSGPDDPGKWKREDIGTYYGTGGNALCYAKNAVWIPFVAGRSAGLRLSAGRPSVDLPWVAYRMEAVTGHRGTGDRVYMDVAPDGLSGRIHGTLGAGMKKDIGFSNKHGDRTAAYMFGEYLQAHRGSGRTPELLPAGSSVRSEAGHPVKVTVIGRTESPSVADIVIPTNRESDNFYAEALFRQAGKALCGSARYDSCSVAMAGAFCDFIKAPAEVRYHDGSGLAPSDRISPLAVCAFLREASGKDWYGMYLTSLVHGETGMVRNCPDAAPETLRRIRYKTGTMAGVRCYSGYILTDGKAPEVFSIMVNGYSGRLSVLSAAIERLLTGLAGKSAEY